MDWQYFFELLLGGLTRGSIYALIAIGYTMVYGIIELINFAHGEVYMLGAFFCVTFIGVLGLGLFPAIVLAMLCCALLGMLIDQVAYKPLRKAPRLAALITAIGVSIFLQNLAMIIWGSRPLPFVQKAIPEFFSQTALSVWVISVTWMEVFIYAVTLMLMAGLTLIINKTRIGTAMRALAQNQTAAALMGINVNRTRYMAVILGGAMAGFGGAYFTLGSVGRFDEVMTAGRGFIALAAGSDQIGVRFDVHAAIHP